MENKAVFNSGLFVFFCTKLSWWVVVMARRRAASFISFTTGLDIINLSLFFSLSLSLSLVTLAVVPEILN